MRGRARAALLVAACALGAGVGPVDVQAQAAAGGAAVASSPAAAPTAAPAAASSARPAFRQDDDLSGLVVRTALALGVVLAVGAVVVVVLRRRAGLPVWQPAAARRLRLVEQLRLGPRTVLHLVELDGRPLLLGQHGDAITAVPPPPAEARTPASPAPSTPSGAA